MLSAESATKAWQLRERASERERFFIDFTYDREVTGNLEKAYQTLESWLQTYPRGDEPPSPYDLLGGLSTQGTGRFERAIETSRKEIAAHPDVAFGYGNLASGYFFLDRFSEAESTLQRASERKLENAESSWSCRYNIALLKGDKEQMDRAVALAKGKRGAEHSDGARGGSCSGSFRPLASGPAVIEPAPWIWLCKRGDARRQRLTRPHERCGKPCAGMLPKRKGTPWRRWRFRTAGMSNTPPALPWLFRETPLDRKRLPMISKSASRKIRSPNLPTLPVLRALSALDRRKPTDSVEQLQIALPYELAVNGLNFNHLYLGGLHSAYVRGEAFVAAHRYAEAAAEFQKILDHRGIVGADPIGALAHLQLGQNIRSRGGPGQGKACLRGFSHPLERRRLRHSDSGASKGGVRPAAIAPVSTHPLRLRVPSADAAEREHRAAASARKVQ